jgi:hypothetical protein
MKRSLVIGLSIWFFALSVLAQSNDGTLLLSVKDQLGAAVADADVTVTPSGTGAKVWTARTDRRGSARITKLPAGDYKVVVLAQGFMDSRDKQFSLRNGETNNVEVTLDIAPIESNVEVAENEAVDPEKTGATAVLNEKAIENLPDNQEDLERAIKRIGEAVTGEELPISVNGVEGAKIPPKAAIQQIRVNQNVFSAQYDGPFGGGIEIFTRSSVDKYRAYVGFTFADSRLNASDPFIGKRVPYQARTFYVNLSGPLFGKKANFYFYGSHSNNDSSSVINAIVLNSSFQPVEFKETLSTPNQSDSFNLTINADPTPKHKLYVNYGLNVSRASNQNSGGFSLPSRANNTRNQNHYFQFSDTFLINANVVNQSRVFVVYNSSKSFGGNSDPAINVLDAFFGGGSQQNTSSGNYRFDASNETTWQMGRYALGFGFRVRGEHLTQNSSNNFGGTYTFSGRIAPVLDTNGSPVLNNDGSIRTTQINSLEAYRRTLLFRSLGYTSQQIRQLGGGANQFTISGGDPRLRASQYEVGLYVQNSYKITETLAASFGVRYENQSNISSNFDVAPRFGIIWSPKAKDKQNPLTTLPRVSVGYGLFYSRFGLNNTVSVRQASDPDRLQYLITETNVLDIFPGVPTVNLLQQFALPRTQRFINDGFHTPYQSLVTVTANKRMPKGFSLNFSFSAGRLFRQSFTQNINAPLAGTFNPLNPSTAIRPFGNVGNIYESRSEGKTQNDRFSVNLGLPQSQKMFGGFRYSYARTRSSLGTGSGSPFDPYDFSQEFGPGPFDGVHSGGGYFYYNLPARFSIGTDFSINRGNRFNITTGRDTNGDGYYSERPSFATNLSKPGLISTPYGVLDPNPSPGDSLIPRNLGRGTKTIYFNASITKSFAFNENKAKKIPPKQSLNFSLRVNNLFNIINRGIPVGNMASPNFLRSLSSFSDGGITTINGAVQENFAGRSMNVSVGFSF